MNAKSSRRIRHLASVLLCLLCVTLPGCYPATGMEDDVFLVNGERQSTSDSDIQLYPVVPNPLSYSGKISWKSSKPHRVKITIRTEDWRLVRQLLDESITPGTFTIDWVCQLLPSGVYYIVLEYESGTHVGRAIVVR